MDATDRALVEAIHTGDDQALETLLAKYAPAVYRFGLRMCRDPEDAKDVLQDTLFAAARGLREFRAASSLSTWLYTVARSFCLKKRRRSKDEPATTEPLDERVAGVPSRERPPDENAARRELAAVLEDALTRLDPTYREVLLLRDVEGLTAPEVAEILGVSIDAVKSRLHRARAELRARLEPLLSPEERPSALPGTAECPEVVAIYSRYLEGEIGTAECEEMDRHVAACGRCRAACTSLRHTLALCRTAATADVPVEVQNLVKKALRDLVAQSTTIPS
jgi:RNA polymerase sigma-70 factor (ECF subfamily)